MFRFLASLIFIAIFYLVSAQDIQPQPMPEPTTVYTCGEDFQPVDLAFDKKDVLYVIEAPQHDTKPAVYNFLNSNCSTIPLASDYSLNTIATNTEGAVCIPYQVYKRGGEYPASSVVSCWNDKDWIQQSKLSKYAPPLGLAFSSQKMWLTHNPVWGKPNPSLGKESGGISYFKDGELISTWLRTTFTVAHQPTFVVATGDKAIFSELNFGGDYTMPLIGGSVTEIDSDGVIKVLKDDFELPTGITIIDDFLWVADYVKGELYHLGMNGNTKAIYQGLQGPMGITQAPNGDICVAEMRGARISCYSLASLSLF